MSGKFKTYQNLSEYQALTFEDRLKNYLFEGEIIKIKQALIEDPIVDIRDLGHNFILAEVMKDFRVRKSMAEKLIRLDKQMRSTGLALKIYELHRSLVQQRKEFIIIQADLAKQNPGISPAELYSKTTEFIADPDLCPPHSTGGAVDLTLVNLSTGQELDMGTSMNAIDEKSALFEENISATAKANRQLLYQGMLSQEFAPMCTEWWHYSYGDCYWAAIYLQKQLFAKLDL